MRQVTAVDIRCELPFRRVIITKKWQTPLLIFLVVYAGERLPLTHPAADQIRDTVCRTSSDTAIRIRGFEIAKSELSVSRPFPSRILDASIEERTK